MKETEVHCDHIPALGGMAVVCHIPYNVPAKLYHKERNPPMIGHCDQFRFFRLHIFPGFHTLHRIQSAFAFARSHGFL